jgi:hypothetical protein
MTTGQSVITLPETDAQTLCLRFTGAVTKKDHYDYLVVPMRAIIEKYGYYNLVLVFDPTYQGYTPDAAEQSFNTINELGKFSRRIAYVNPSPRKMFQTSLTRILLGKDVRNFSTEELAEAIAWAKE